MFIQTWRDPEFRRSGMQVITSVRAGAQIRRKIPRHWGVVCKETELADIKRLARPQHSTNAFGCSVTR